MSRTARTYFQAAKCIGAWLGLLLALVLLAYGLVQAALRVAT